jgi:hypothetical protein
MQYLASSFVLEEINFKLPLSYWFNDGDRNKETSFESEVRKRQFLKPHGLMAFPNHSITPAESQIEILSAV